MELLTADDWRFPVLSVGVGMVVGEVAAVGIGNFAAGGIGSLEKFAAGNFDTQIWSSAVVADISSVVDTLVAGGQTVCPDTHLRSVLTDRNCNNVTVVLNFFPSMHLKCWQTLSPSLLLVQFLQALHFLFSLLSSLQLSSLLLTPHHLLVIL